jgi:hypothetical protein
MDLIVIGERCEGAVASQHASRRPVASLCAGINPRLATPLARFAFSAVISFGVFLLFANCRRAVFCVEYYRVSHKRP